ncbi:hypothetical protein DFH07DRAFT_797561 [Mycena maculata]|uniref:F-box domain-containing protein n=1 Tax=Mycena maculata TaxID=230809 RepID=A0AAD7K3S0_9AGAR|nr:hypothetical protein DFH07DRAFT_797561 [Mycena maculata]
MPTTIAGLEQDVVLYILGFCDIYTVLSVSRVNRHLHIAASVKQLWISLVNDLRRCGLMEVPPSYTPSQYTTTKLQEQVKRLLTGPETWLLPPPSPPALACEIVIPTQANMTKYRQDGRVQVQLINGGRYVIIMTRPVDNPATIEVWDVAGTRCIWTRTENIERFSVDPAINGNQLVLALVFRDISDFSSRLEVVQIDPSSGMFRVFAAIPLPRYSFVPDISLAGDLVVVSVVEPGWQLEILVIDWRAQRYVLLNELGGTRPVVRIIPGHLVVITRDTGPTHLLVYATVAFSSDWRSVCDSDPFHARLRIQKLTPLVDETLEFQNDHPAPTSVTLVMTITESPIRHGVYRIAIYASEVLQASATVFVYECVMISPNSIRCALKSVTPAGPGMQLQGFTYSGYSVSKEPGYPVYRMCNTQDFNDRSTSSITLAPLRECVWRDLSPYSCVITSLLPSSVVLRLRRTRPLVLVQYDSPWPQHSPPTPNTTNYGPCALPPV